MAKKVEESLLHWSASTVGRPAGHQCQTRAGAPVRKLEEELRIEKDVLGSSALLASGLADKVGEQDNKLETFSVILQSSEGASCHGLRCELL